MRSIWPFRQFGLKVLSLGLGLSLWMVVSGEETVERGLRVPLELQQFPPGLELQGETPSTVDVRVRGASGALSRVSAGDVVAVLDLHGAGVGQRLFHLTPDQVQAPFGLEVVQVTPATVAMTFENSASRKVPIVPAVEGKPAPGYVLGKVSVQPETAEVVGPESAVARVTEAITEPVQVAGAREGVKEPVTVGLRDPLLRVKGSRAATVTVEVLPAPLERTLRAVPVHLRHLATKLNGEASPAVVSIGLRGSREGLNGIDVDDVAAYVDLAGLGAGSYTLTVRADVSREAGVVRIEPATIHVRLSGVKD
jgi:YbbR domain-containing protein